MKHKHSEVIKAFADGIECEFLDVLTSYWEKINYLNDFDHFDKVRIKPAQINEELASKEPQYLYVYNDANRRESWMSTTLLRETYGWHYMGKVEVIK